MQSDTLKTVETNTIVTDKKHQQSAYIWNTVGGLLMAFQSVVMLMVIMRVGDLVTAGVFTFAYATANLFLNIGKYGMRNFQVSDVKPVFSFALYRTSRLLTSTAMIAAAFAYTLWSSVTFGYSADKTLVIILMCVFKLVDAIEDVFCGNFQQNGRLDVAGKLLTFRLAATIVVFAGCIVGFGGSSLVVPLLVSTIFTILFLVATLVYTRRRYRLPFDAGIDRGGTLGTLLKECLPLFLAAFLLFYIGNAPKYAIDALLNDSAQALYGFIAMPVFVVNLLSGFVYAPIIAPLSRMWAHEDQSAFLREFMKQVIWIVGITVVSVALAWFLGIPVLNLLYNTDVSAYLVELCVLVTGGGFLALASLFTIGITIMRRQTWLVWGYSVVALLAFFGSAYAVSHGGIAGASWIYLIMMALLALWFAFAFALGFRGKRCRRTE